MSDALQEAIATLYRAPLSAFVAERKRLAAELKAAGQKQHAAEVAKLGRPSLSAWAVNQLWWQERASFEALLEAAARLQRGDREAGHQHRERLTELRHKASRLLQAEGSAASEATLRRVIATLSAVAASGGFAPDPGGALSADRDPPGFEALEGLLGVTAPAAGPKHASERDEEQRRRLEREQRERRLAERERLSAALREAKQLREGQLRELTRLRKELEAAEHEVQRADQLIEQLERQLTDL